VSNFFFEQGAWTPWQMAAWAGVGVGGGLLARVAGRSLGRWPLAVACALAGLGFGAVMDTFQWTLAARQDLPTWIAVSGQSLPFNLAHAIGNFAFCLALGPAFVRALQRFRRRFEFIWSEPATAAGVLLAILALAGALAAPPRAEASTASRALSYLRAAQNGDGGFGGARGASSSQLYTGWTALGLAAAGRGPHEAGPSGRSAVDYMRAHASELNDVGELERSILVLRAGGGSVRHFDGRDLVKELLEHQRGSGSFDGLLNHTAFGVLALKAAGAGTGAIAQATSWLARQQSGDGGFGFAPKAASDVDDTGAALQALSAGGRGGSDGVRRAVKFLRGAQRSDGGFGQYPDSSSNAQSTAWAVQGVVAVGRDPNSLRRGGHTPLSYIRSLARGDGSIRYSRSSSQTPVWVTAQALTALEREAFPLGAVKARHPGRGAAAGRNHGKSGRGHAKGGAGAGAGVVPGSSAAPAGGAGGPSAEALRRAAERVGTASGSSPSAATILMLSGGALLLLAAAASWRYRRLARRMGDPPPL
jgi:prenyltransferase/squalene oxidase-like repeat protein